MTSSPDQPHEKSISLPQVRRHCLGCNQFGSESCRSFHAAAHGDPAKEKMLKQAAAQERQRLADNGETPHAPRCAH